ncbi:hypothetical protein HMPREF9056_01362 [Actinomyces sp. oral taxon 170 str. F0386]|nr:hypothetical protein HMPREF9056_01362 [Actinomyces sp. oral taxon 170 str. F0386]
MSDTLMTKRRPQVVLTTYSAALNPKLRPDEIPTILRMIDVSALVEARMGPMGA